MQLMINGVLGAVFFTLLFVTGNTMMQSVRERIPEFAILKTYGFTDVIVSGLVLAESLALCVLGALVGMWAAAKLLFPFIFASFKLDPLTMPFSVVAIGVLLAVVLAVATGLPPALRVGRLNIVDALAGR
jgi:putative ABC transport system permease protein